MSAEETLEMGELEDRFSGKAQTVLKKKAFLEEYQRNGYMMKKAAATVGITPGHFTKWLGTDKKFEECYLELKKKKKEPESPRKYNMKTPMTLEEIATVKTAFIDLFSGKQLSLAQCLEKLDISMGLIRNWFVTDKNFREAYQDIVKKKRGLVDDKGELRMDLIEKATEAKVDARIQRQELWLKEFSAGSFNISTACKKLGIRRETFRMWCKKYPEFNQAYEEIMEEKKDFVEGKLLENIRANDSACIIFAAKTLLKERGYVEKQEIALSGNFGVMVVPGRAENVSSWAEKAAMQQQQLKENSIALEIEQELRIDR